MKGKKLFVTHHELMDKSFDFIRKNMETDTDGIPRHLQEFWMVEDLRACEHLSKDEQYKYEIFSFALEEYRARNLRKAPDLSRDALLSLFTDFQMLLLVANTSPAYRAYYGAIPLFDFDKYPRCIRNLSHPEVLSQQLDVVMTRVKNFATPAR